jgi:hypothetical protein
MQQFECIELIKKSYYALMQSMEKLETAIMADHCYRYSAFIPHSLESNDSTSDRKMAIRSINRLNNHELDKKTGLLGCSKKTIQVIEDLNEKKQAFKESIAKITKQSQLNAKGIHSELEVIRKGYRSSLLTQSLNAIKGKRLDLRVCYAQVLILPKNTISVSWTWDMTHNRTKKCTHQHAFELAEAIQNSDHQLAVKIQLKQLKQGDRLTQLIPQTPQLYANIQFMKGGHVRRKSYTVSGILCIEKKKLPPYIWRDQPLETSERLERRDKKTRTLLIPSLQIYKEEMKNKKLLEH